MATPAKRRAPRVPADNPSSDAVAVVDTAAAVADAAPASAPKPPRARKTAAAKPRPGQGEGPTAEPAAEPTEAPAARKRAKVAAAQPATDGEAAAKPATRARKPAAKRERAKPVAAEAQPVALTTEPEAPAAELVTEGAVVAPAAEPPSEAPAEVIEVAQPVEPVELAEPEPEATSTMAAGEPQSAVEPVLVEPAVPVAPPPPRPAHSQITLQDDGLRRRLRWQSGSRCPESLLDAVAPLQQAGGTLALASADALSELLAQATRAGHRLLVEDAVWQHLALQGDLHGRIDHLAERYPQGLEGVSLPEAAWPLSPRPAQLEAAFFLACVGACLVADEAELQPAREAALAWQLVHRHFGAERLTVIAPAARLPEWQALLASVDPASLQWLAAEDALDAARIAGAHALIVDQRDGLREPLPALDAEPTWCWVLCPPDLLQADRAAAEAWLRRIDRQRNGALADWLDGEGDTVLAPLLLQRRFADVALQWPAFAPQTVAAPLPEAQRVRHDQAQSAARQLLARWQRSGFLADSEQLALQRHLQAQQQACREAGEAVLPALLQQALAEGTQRVVVFSEDADGLSALAERLAAAGLPTVALAGGLNQREGLLREFRDTAEPQVLLVADGLPGDEPRIVVQQRPLVVLLDRPWDAAVTERRLQRVRAGRVQRSLPVLQLLPADSLASRREALPAVAEAAAPSAGLRRGAALQAWLAELQACLAQPTLPADEAHAGA